eukprot:866987-Rhodomonas_salina.1
MSGTDVAYHVLCSLRCCYAMSGPDIATLLPGGNAGDQLWCDPSTGMPSYPPTHFLCNARY